MGFGSRLHKARSRVNEQRKQVNKKSVNKSQKKKKTSYIADMWKDWKRGKYLELLAAMLNCHHSVIQIIIYNNEQKNVKLMRW